MKNYIANGRYNNPEVPRNCDDLERFLDSGTWDTSRAYVRRTLERCIELGRIYRSSGDHEREKYEAFRLLGAAVSTPGLRVSYIGTQVLIVFTGKAAHLRRFYGSLEFL